MGMLNYLAGSTRPDLAMSVHQVAQFCADPKRSHEKGVMRIARCLLTTAKFSMIYKLDLNRGIEVCADADFAGLWTHETAFDANSVLSRTGYVILLFGCPLFWHSKLQLEIALSTTEAECIAMSQALRNVIPLINLMNKLILHFDISCIKPTMKCTVFEDNQSTIAVTRAPSMLPRTKHIGLKYHHFRQAIQQGIISIECVPTADQLADIFTKPLPAPSFTCLRHKLLGW